MIYAHSRRGLFLLEKPKVGHGARSNVLQHLIGEDGAGQRLDRVLVGLLPAVPRTRIFRLIRKGEVRVNGKRARPEQRLAAGDRVRVPPVHERSMTAQTVATGGAARVPPALINRVLASIVHEDERVLVLDKPAGLAVHGGSGLTYGVIEALRAARPGETLELAHRLDRDTSGLLLIARKPAALRILHALLREGAVQKSYLALVVGRWELGRKLVNVPLQTEARVSGERTVRVGEGGKSARTQFQLVQQYGAHASLLEATLETGRTHQIRVHAAYCGHPVAGDVKYGDAAANAALREAGLQRMFLHAHSVSLDWPQGGALTLSSPLPAELKAVLDQLTQLRSGTGPKAGRNRRSAGSRRA
jgi:23S rRNA pseudouridine955/2504/2580 synthase